MIDVAIILAGGKGSRLAPWPAPKSLMPLAGIPIIERLISHIKSFVNRIIVCTGYRASDIHAALSKHDHILFSNGIEDDFMCQRLIRAKNEFNIVQRAIVLYGDEISDINIGVMEEQHQRQNALATYACVRQRIPFGVADEENSKINDDMKVLVNIGYAIVEPECWSFIQPTFGLSQWLNEINTRSCRVYKYVFEGKRSTINNLSELLAAEEVWS